MKKEGLKILAKIFANAAVRADGKASEYGAYQPKKPINKKKTLDGILTGYDESSITMMYENNEITIERKNISLMKLKYNWD